MGNFRRLVFRLVLLASYAESVSMTETIPLSTYIDVNSFTIVVITCGIFAAASHLSGSTKAFAF